MTAAITPTYTTEESGSSTMVHEIAPSEDPLDGHTCEQESSPGTTLEPQWPDGTILCDNYPEGASMIWGFDLDRAPLIVLHGTFTRAGLNLVFDDNTNNLNPVKSQLGMVDESGTVQWQSLVPFGGTGLGGGPECGLLIGHMGGPESRFPTQAGSLLAWPRRKYIDRFRPFSIVTHGTWIPESE
jgi:hypothetical protein